MCTGAMILYGIKRCVMGENSTFVGGESVLKDHGVEIVNLNLDSCKDMMAQFIKQSPEIWNEVSLLPAVQRVHALRIHNYVPISHCWLRQYELTVRFWPLSGYWRAGLAIVQAREMSML
jgi:hypothetical protein